MPKQGKQIIAPINVIADVSSMLGAGSGDIGYLCSNRHGRINKWAKHKPTRYNSVGAGPETAYKDNYGMCGLELTKVYGSKMDLINGVDNGDSQWRYLPPRGSGYNEPYRITDFENYLHNATSPFGRIYNQSIVLNGGNVIVSGTPPIAGGSDTQLTLSDFSYPEYNFSEWYFGILLNGESQWLATTKKKIKDSLDWSVNFGTRPNNSPGQYIAYPVLSSAIWTPGSPDPASVKIVVVEDSVATVKLVADSEAYSTNVYCCFKNGQGNTLTYDVHIINNTSSPRNFANVTLQIAADAIGTGATTVVNFGNVNGLAGGATWRRAGVSNIARSDARTYYKTARLTYTGQGAASWVGIVQDFTPLG